jgi:hypothetical protein
VSVAVDVAVLGSAFVTLAFSDVELVSVTVLPPGVVIVEDVFAGIVAVVVLPDVVTGGLYWARAALCASIATDRCVPKVCVCPVATFTTWCSSDAARPTPPIAARPTSMTAVATPAMAKRRLCGRRIGVACAASRRTRSSGAAGRAVRNSRSVLVFLPRQNCI